MPARFGRIGLERACVLAWSALLVSASSMDAPSSLLPVLSLALAAIAVSYDLVAYLRFVVVCGHCVRFGRSALQVVWELAA